jgi:DNA-directed RNA polymerase
LALIACIFLCILKGEIIKIEQQLQLEKEANDYSYDRLVREIGKRIEYNKADELKEGKLILVHSIDVVAKKLEEFFNAPVKGKTRAIKEFIASEFHNDTKSLAYVIIATLVRLISKDVYVPTTTAISSINTSLHQSILLRRLEKKAAKLEAYVDKKYSHRSKAYRKREKLKIMKHKDTFADSHLQKETLNAGAYLLETVIKSGCNIVDKKTITYKKQHRQYLVYTEECFRMVLQSRERLLTDYRKYPIFVVPPTDWCSFDGSGGYYTKEVYQVPIIKTYGEPKKLLRQYFKEGNVKPLYNTLNAIQKTSWRINKRVWIISLLTM